MKSFRPWLLVAGLLIACAGSVFAQAPAPSPSPAPQSDAQKLDAAGLTKDAEIGRLKVERAQLSIRLSQTEAQLSALSTAFDALLKADAQRVGQALDAELKPSHDAIVTALGGDPAKGDTFDFVKKILVKKAEPPKDVK